MIIMPLNSDRKEFEMLTMYLERKLEKAKKEKPGLVICPYCGRDVSGRDPDAEYIKRKGDQEYFFHKKCLYMVSNNQ